MEIIEAPGEQFSDFAQALADNDDISNLKSNLVKQNCKNGRIRQSIMVSEEVQAWSRYCGILVGPGEGELGLSLNDKWKRSRVGPQS